MRLIGHAGAGRVGLAKGVIPATELDQIQNSLPLTRASHPSGVGLFVSGCHLKNGV
jgi:hypothetical protein